MNGPTDPEKSMAAELDEAAAALLGIWESAREGTANRVSGAQLRAVMVVEQHDGINLRRLATRLDMLLSSASRLCDRLVAAGMLEREPGRFDRREIALHLTPEARRLLAELRADRQAQLAAVLAKMSPEGRDALLSGMREFDESARRQQAQSASAAGESGQGDWPDDPDRPTVRSRDWSVDPDRQTRTVWAGPSGGPERSIGTNRDWPAGDPPVARTA
ncbi:MarR family winged helix-turn-helix transcriptional regulator [Micromonospora parathelypteridis]|uniref:DNA-binding MarR family transcriptional regulator n=1 Tax=Micromonospora parathelypteridis TaxID=1839617 RepID=A0A840VT95_9ACTN|nr:MarR family transcriptional regulator [Micromonospora parathelypteridis]MBB5477184.1 DNA-binding MarR family transcriptional regulator [Micromonospora parathelypteridis]